MMYIFLKQNIIYEKSIVLPLAQMFPSLQFTLVQSLSHVQLFATPWSAAHQASLSMTNSQSLLKFMSIESMMATNHLILCHCPLLLLPSIFPSIRVFSNELVLFIKCHYAARNGIYGFLAFH